jgi:catechol 2,3-dioxygenase-like lactoylglutathione lyase family enzyme
MTQRLSLTALLVRDYDEAIGFYVGKLGFTLTSDADLGGGKRWVVVQPAGGGAGILLAQPSNDAQAARIGDQTGKRVFLILETSDFAGDHARRLTAGVRFHEEPRHEPYGVVAVFEDLYGNRWDLIEPKT